MPPSIRYQFSVARQVYNLFVLTFDLDDHTVIVTRKNANNLDCYYKNLILKSISDVAIAGFKTGKRKSLFQLEVKPVTQYDTKGKIIHRYKTAADASKASGLPSNYISDAARTKDRMAGGYYWRYGKGLPEIKIPKLKKQRNYTNDIHHKKHHGLNRNLQNLPGEIWKNVEKFDGLYQISNFGRIKSLRRLKEITTHKNNKTQYWTKEFIMKQSIVSEKKTMCIQSP